MGKGFALQGGLELRNCGERAKDGRGLVTALWWGFFCWRGRHGTPGQPDPKGRPMVRLIGLILLIRLIGLILLSG